ncbi:MAG: lipopolysaccharide heptosyltransferase II [Planctomycetota bacterium]|nr:lipopolysaccharide heptosyltransferase II [Planctomycetota bacterium]
MMLTDNPARLMIIMPSWVGDVVMATPALRLLHAHYPSAEITAALRPGLAPLLGGLEDVHACIEIQPKGLIGPWQAGRAMASTRPDAVILLPNSIRSALAARLSGTSVRIGFSRQGRARLLTEAVPPPSTETVHTTLNDYLALAMAITGDTELDDRQPRLAVTESDTRAATAAMALDDGPFVVLVPGANRTDKRWPTANFTQIAERLAHDHGLRVAIAGSPTEQPLVETILQSANCEIIDLASARPGLGGLKAILQAASLVITNDTGPRHIAAALGTPIVSLFGPTDHRWTVLPGIVERRMLAEPFLPESMIANRCPSVCRIDRITVQDVHAAAAALLSEEAEATSPMQPAP